MLRLKDEYVVKASSGYSSKGIPFCAVTHMHIDELMTDQAIKAMIALGNS